MLKARNSVGLAKLSAKHYITTMSSSTQRNKISLKCLLLNVLIKSQADLHHLRKARRYKQESLNERKFKGHHIILSLS